MIESWLGDVAPGATIRVSRLVQVERETTDHVTGWSNPGDASLHAMKACGKGVVPVFEETLRDPSLADFHYRVIETPGFRDFWRSYPHLEDGNEACNRLLGDSH